MKVIDNGDVGPKRKSENSRSGGKRKRVKTNVPLLTPEEMSAGEICFVLQKRGIDFEDIRRQLVNRLKKVIKGEQDNLKVIETIKEIEKTYKRERDYVEPGMNSEPLASLSNLPDLPLEIICLLYTSPRPRDS